STYGRACPVSVLAQRIARFMQLYTLYASVRAFGATLMLAGVDYEGTTTTPRLYVVDPSGTARACHGMAIGQNQRDARGELETLMGVDTASISRQARAGDRPTVSNEYMSLDSQRLVFEAARVVYSAHDDNDKDITLELGIISEDGGASILRGQEAEEISERAQTAARTESDSEDSAENGMVVE
ncbi:proteasome, subunit alpha/beta, partial [Kipferlia bialata]